MGQAMMIEKIVQRGKLKEDKIYKNVEFTDEMREEILSAYEGDGITFDQAKLNAAVESVKQKLADKMTVTKAEKANAWRYLSMLGNPKTHIRNIVSNVANYATISLKDVVATTLETGVDLGAKVLGKDSPFEYRTKTFKTASDDVKDFAKKTAEAEKATINGNAHADNVSADIKSKRSIFKHKILNDVYEFDDEWLEREDWWFSGAEYRRSLAKFLTANGIRTQADIDNKANEKLIEKAKKYALERAEIATFRQYSWLANKISEIER